MKLKATKKSFAGYNVVKVGYCNLQYLLNYENAFAYSSGAYGWSCDYYDINGVIISTGYSPIGKSVDYELIKKYNLKAEKIVNNYELSYEVRKKQVKKLLNEFIEKVRG